MLQEVDLDMIDPSPFQHRKHFAEAKLAELARSIQREGLVEPVVVRPVGGRFQLIAGERRVRAARLLSECRTILARVVEVDDLQARRMCAAENMQRDDLSAVESVAAIVEIVDAELVEYSEYVARGDDPVMRVRRLLGELHAFDMNRQQGKEVAPARIDQVNKFINLIQPIFRNLPKPIEWRSFFMNDLKLVTDIDAEVRAIAERNKLNKSQTKELQEIKERAPELFGQIVSAETDADGRTVLNTDDLIAAGISADGGSTEVELSDLSARELKQARIEIELLLARERQPVLLPEPPPPSGKYRCVIIDPPWPMQKIEREERPKQGIELDYRTMSLEEIEEKVRGYLDESADDRCHLYLWVTQKFLPAGLRLLESWGFTYQCVLTWVKPTGMTPYSWMYNTEHVLFGSRGGLPLQKLGLKLSFEGKVEGHSIKPQTFYDRVMEASPEPRLDMYARKEREGFHVWGNEVPGDAA